MPLLQKLQLLGLDHDGAETLTEFGDFLVIRKGGWSIGTILRGTGTSLGILSIPSFLHRVIQA